MQPTSESLRAWFRRVESIYPELFNAAHAMCGSYDAAEFALRCALLDLWTEEAGAAGFRDRLRAALRQECLDAVLHPEPDDEFTWKGLNLAASDDPVLRLAAQERPETQRILTLRFGCGLPAKDIAAMTGATPHQVRAAVDRFEARCLRALESRSRAGADAIIAQRFRRALSRPGDDLPSLARLYRAFESEALQTPVKHHRASRIIGRAALLLMALLCAGVFWLFAVLVQPATLPEGAQAAPPIQAEESAEASP